MVGLGERQAGAVGAPASRPRGYLDGFSQPFLEGKSFGIWRCQKGAFCHKSSRKAFKSDKRLETP